MNRTALVPVAAVLLAATGCFGGTASGSGPRQPPACTPGARCIDAHGHAETCNIGGECPDLCQPGEPRCCLTSLDCAGSAANPGYCAKDTGTCKLLCAGDSDCATLAHVAGDCHGAGCVCDDGRCETPPCATDADCPAGKRCVAGTCAEGLAATACTVLPGPIVVRPGTGRTLTAVAKAGSRFGPPATPITWSSSAPSVASVDPSTGRVEGGPDAGAAEITATTGQVACGAEVRNLGPADASILRVVAIDPATHAGVPGLTVVVRRPGVAPVTATTGARGVADLPGIAAGPVAVDVLDLAGPGPGAPNGRTWVTLTQVTARDLLVPVPANPDPDAAGGIRGTLDAEAFQALSDDSAHVGLVGLSWPGDPASLDLVRLSGPYVQVNLTNTWVGSRIGLPSGLVLGVGDRMADPGFAAVGIPGRRVRFALFGNAPLSNAANNLAGLIDFGQTVPAGDMAAGVLPDLDQRQVTDGVTPLTPVVPRPLVGGAPDLTGLRNVEVTAGPRLRHRVDVELPPLPAAPANAVAPWLGGLMMIPGVFAPGEGFTPLGLTFSVDVRDPLDGEAPDGRIDGPRLLPATSLQVRYAPPNGGLEGRSPYLVVLAGSPDSLAGDPSADPARSERLIPLAGLPFGDAVDASGPMLPVPTSARWDAATRTAAGAFPPADLHRWTFEDDLGRRWVVLTPGDASSVTLPDESVRCAASVCVDPSVKVIRARAEAVRLAGHLGYQGLLRLDGTDLDRLPRLTREASRAAVALP